MRRPAPAGLFWIVAAGGIMLGAAAGWFRPAGLLSLAPLAVALIALVLAFLGQRRSAALIEDQRHQIESAAQLRLQIIEALSLAIDARHRTTQSVRREQAYAMALARAFGMPDQEVEGVRTAALLHDVGKLAVPDHILTKPGPLTPEELRKVRIHPQVGAGIIAGVPFPYPVASLVLAHHERWDGTGYPSGLRGTEIPIGARILACVDHYEALTSDRPFHRALPAREALDILWAEAGKALDPAVVARFAELLPTLQLTAVDGAELTQQALGAIAGDGGRLQIPEGTTLQAPPAVLRDIAQANSEIHRLYDMSRAIGTTLGVADSMTVIAAKLQNLVPFGACALFLLESSKGIVRCQFATGLSAERLRRLTVPVGTGAVGRVASTRQCLVNAEPSLDTTAASLDSDAIPFKSLLACPLIVSDGVVGVLALYHSEVHAFTEDHRRLVQLVSEQAAAVILNSVVFEQTQVDSVTDALTGLPNIRLLFVHLTRELSRASRLDTPVSLLLLDLDNLKDINDTYGHSTGDHALCKVATALAAAIRPYDLCVRYGGDEFIVVLSGCGREEADAKLVELQQAIDAIVFEATGRQRVRLSVSAGAAVFPQDGKAYESLLAVADRRMYQDKTHRKQGRRHTRGSAGAPGLSDVDLERAAQGVL